MGFLESTSNLSGTCYPQEDLKQARIYLSGAIKKQDPSWFERREGKLFEYWKREDDEAVCFLIHFAGIFAGLGKNITKKSVPIFLDKFNELLKVKDREQFEELLGELQLAGILCKYVSPISFEPLVPSFLDTARKKPKSPDYAIRLPGADVEIEVTTFRFGILTQWSRLGDHLRKKISSRLLTRKNLSCHLTIVIPLEFNSLSLLPEYFVEELTDEISQGEAGEKIIPIKQQKAIFQWRPIVISDDESNQVLRNLPKGKIISSAVEFQTQLPEEDNKEIFLRSFRNLLDKKREQSSRTNPYVMAVQFGHPALHVEGLKQALQERIWPNATYKWLTGVFIFFPVTRFRKTDPPPSLHYLSNPNSSLPFPTSLLAMFEQGKRYHLRDGEYYSE